MSISTFDRENLNRVTPRAFRSKLGDLIQQSQSGVLVVTPTATSLALTEDDYYVRATGAGAKTITLPLAASVAAGKRFEVKAVGAGQVTIAPSGSDTIDGVSGNDATMVQWERRVFTSNGVDGYET
jgi:hypothetical protein